MQMRFSWQAFEDRDFTGKMCVLEVGSYPDLRAMGCVSSSSIQSLKTVGFVSLFVHSSKTFPPTTIMQIASLILWKPI